MTKTKKILGIVLVVMLLALAMSISAFAATTVTTETDLKSAVADGGEIVLGAEFADLSDLDLTISKDTVLDLGGKILTDAYITVSGKVTIKNGSIVNTTEPYALKVTGSGELTIEDVDIKYSSSDRAIWLDGNKSVLNFNSGSILATKGANNTKSKIYGIWVSTGATANINGGSITVDAGPDATAVAIFGNYVNTVNITDGKISTSGKTYSYAVWTNGDVTVSGGEIITNEKQYGYSSGITYGKNYAINTTGNVEISGGSITTNGPSGYLVNVGGSNQEVTISNVEFKNVLSEADKTAGGHSEPNLIYGSNVIVEITSGSFEGVNEQLINNTSTGSTVTVSGGSFSAIDDAYIEVGATVEIAGKVVVKNEDGTLETASYAAKIGNQYYETLQAALNAVKDGETITLLAECAETVSINKSSVAFIIDGNNATFTGKIEINVGQNVTIKNVKFVHTADAACDFIANVGSPTGKNYNTTLLVEDCTFTGNGKDNTVAVKTIHPTSVTIKNCIGEGLHSFLQNTGGQNVVVDNVTVTDSKSGISLGGVRGATVKNSKISASDVGYGIRVDAATENAVITIESCEISAFIPVVARKASASNVAFTVNGTNTMTATNTDGLWMAIGVEEYGDVDKDNLTLPSGKVVVTINDADLNKTGVYGAYKEPPKGDVPHAYVGATTIWGETWSNSKESYVLKFYNGETLMGTAELNTALYTFTGSQAPTWHINFNDLDGDDEWWIQKWVVTPSVDNFPTRVVLCVDGADVNEGPVQFNGPDNFNKIYALAEGYTGGLVAYTSLADAIGDFNGRKVNVVRDVTESIALMNGATLTTNVAGGVTVTNTYDGWVRANDLVIGKGVTVKAGSFFYNTDGENEITGSLVVDGTFYHGYDATTVIKDGGNVIVNGTTILRYNKNTDSGIYIYGDGDDSTVEFDCDYYIGAYSGTFYAEDATIETGYFLLKNSYDNSDYANIDMTLDNSTLTVVGTTDTQDSFIIDDQASLKLVNGSAIADVRDFNILAGTNLTLSVDETSSLEATYVNIAEGVPFVAEKNEDGTIKLEKFAIKVTYADGTVEYFNDMLKAVPYTTNYPKLEGATITLLDDCSGAGLRFMENDMVFDLNGFTYTITAGTGSQGTNTSGFQIRPEVTTDVLFKNGTIKVAEGAPVIWMFNCYATDFVIEDVTVDCTNMAWSYGESCYVVVSRSGDNVQLVGKSKIENFNTEVAGPSINVGGTMTIGENVVVIGAIELDAGATLTTTRTDLEIVTADGYIVEYNNGTYESVKAVAQVGDKYYTDLHEAMVAAKGGETVKLLCDVDLAGTEWEPVSFAGAFDGQNFKISNLTINKPGVSNVGFIASLNGKFENVTFVNPTVTGGECTGVVAGRAGGSAALANNITVTGTIKIETTHSGYARAGVIVGGWAYGSYKNITVNGLDKDTSYIKHTGGGDGRYVAGIVGHADGVNSYEYCTVKNLTITGGWLCGGIAGPGPANGLATGCAVENINVNADYSGGMFGWYYGSGTIEDSSVSDVTFIGGSTKNGAIGGYSNNTSATVNNVTITNVKNVDGTPLLNNVAEVNGVYYDSLQAAFDAAQAGDTINLYKDVTLDEVFLINKSIILNGNNHKITSNASRVIRVNASNVEVTLNGVNMVSTAVRVGTNDIRGISIDASLTNVKLTLNNSSVDFTDASACDWAYAVNVSGSGTGHVVTIDGGSYEGANVINVHGAKNTITVKNATLTSMYPYNDMYCGVAIWVLQEQGSSVEATGNTFIGSNAIAFSIGTGTALTESNNIDNTKRVVAKIGDTYFHSLADAIAAIGTGDVVIELLADATLDYNAREAYGLADTTSVTINGNGHTLTLNQKNSDWSSIGLANADAKLVLNNMTIEKTGYGDTSGAWNTHAIIFKCNVEMNDVTVNNSVAVQNGATLNNVTINEANGYYGLWISANGQKVTMNGGAIYATNGGRGIKIADEYVNDAVANVELNVTGTVFKTAKKAAILVSSTEGASITVNNIDISGVAADSVNAAWVDEDWAANYGKVTVTGGTVSQEAVESFAIIVKDGDKIVSYFNTLDELFDNESAYAEVSTVTVELLSDVVATKVVKTNSLKTYNFVTNVAEGVTMDLQYADNWNYFRKVNIGENVTVEAKYLVFSTETTIAGTVDAYYPYISGGKVTVTETGVLKYAGGDGLQVKGNGAVLTVNGTVIAPTINVWGGNAQLIISGENAKVESNWIDIWDGAPAVTVKNGATIKTNGIKVSRGGSITVNDATLDANSIEVGHNGTSAGILTESGDSTITGEIKMSGTNSVVYSDGGLNVTTSIADHKVVYENGEYKVVPCKYVAQIGENKYESLADAFNAAVNGDEVKILVAGTYALSTSGKNITITGMVDGVVFDNIGAKNMGGASVIFNNVTFDYYPNADYTGLQHSGNLKYNNCIFNGQVFLYGVSEIFNDCTFNQTSSDAYNVWTYGAKTVEFNRCTFNSAGKSVLVYSEDKALVHNVTVVDTDFIASTPVDGKAAIEIDTSYTAGANITIDADTTATGFANGNVSGNSLWNNKKGNEGVNNDITVTVNNEVVLRPYYTSIETGVVYDKDAIGDSRIIFEIKDLNAKNSIVIKVYSGETLIATTTLVKTEYLSYNALTANVEITYNSSSWDTVWHVAPVFNVVPDKAELYIDEQLKDTASIRMYSADVPSDAREWIDIEGVAQPVAEVNGVPYATYEDAINAANPGDTVKLLSDVQLTSKVYIKKSLTLDLNTHTISGETALVNISGDNSDISVKVTNGKITATGGEVAVQVYDGADVTLENVEISGAYYGVKIGGYHRYPSNVEKNNLTSLYINNTSIESENASIIGLGSYPNTYIEINNGSEITSTDSIAIYHPQYGTLKVNGGTITGATAIYLKAGNLVVNGGTIAANGEASDHEFVGSGANSTGDAIVIESCNYGGYGVPTASIIGGTITSANAKAVVSYNQEGYEKVTGFVSGGTFNTPVDAEHCATGYVPTSYVDGDGNTVYGVKVGSYVVENTTTGAKYESLAEALAAAQNNDVITLIWAEGDAPIAMNGAVYGKTVTITGTATVDWSKGFLFIGRGGEGNGTVIFENANLTSASDSASYGIHVSGREKNTNNKYDGTLIINNSTIVLDYLINKGTMTLDNSTLTVKNGFSIGGRPASETESGKDATATLTLNNSSKVVVNKHNGMGLGYEAIGVMNVNAGSTFECTQAFLVTAKGTLNVNDGTVKVADTLTNNGTISVSGTSTINATVTGAGWVYMHGVTLDANTKLIGAKVRFASGENTINGSTITGGFFQVGIGAYNGVDDNVDTVNGVVVNVNNAVIGANGETYAGWVGTGFYDTDAEKADAMTDAKYVLNINNSIAEFGYLHISNDGELNVNGNAAEKKWYNNSDYSFYAGEIIVNGTATFTDTDVLALYTKVSCDNNTDKPGTINIAAGTEYEAERHNGAIGGTNFELYKTGVVNVAEGAKLHIGEYTSIAADAKLNIAGTVTALGEITNKGTITITSVNATLTTPTTTNVVTNVDGYKAEYVEGKYVLVQCEYVAQIGDNKYESLQDAIDAAQAGDTIVLLENVTLNEHLTINEDKEIVLDLAGKKITAIDNSINIKINGKLTVNDTVGDGVSTVRNHMVAGELVLIKGTLQNIETATAGFPVYLDGGKVTINGGTVQAVNQSNYAIGGTGTVEVTNGTINSNYGCINLGAGSTATISGGTFNVTGAIGGHCVYTSGAEVTISGGTFNPSKDCASYAVLTDDASANVTITGGTFNAGMYNYMLLERNGNGNITVYGGTFSKDPSAYLAEGYAAIQNLDGNYVVGEKPTATVKDYGPTIIPGGEYGIWNGKNYTQKGTEDLPLSFVMQFIADQTAADMENSPYADWYADFVITFDGIKDGSLIADKCYLAGFYGDFGWVKIPVDGMKIENGVRYPVMLGVGLGQKYDYICSGVKDFKCALYITPELLDANPDLTVNLELAVVDNSKGENAAASALVKNENVYNVVDYKYEAEDFIVDYVAAVGEKKFTSLVDAIAYANANGGTVTLITDIESNEGFVINGNVTIDLNGKTISIVDDNTEVNCVFNIIGGEVTITNGTVETNNGQAIYVGKDAEGNSYAPSVTLTNVTLTGEKFGLSVFGNATVTIGEDVTITGTEEALRVWDNATVTINGGTITCTGTATETTVARAIAVYGNATVTITAGTVNGEVIAVDANSNIEISGGIFDMPVDKEHCAEGYKPCQVENGYSVVKNDAFGFAGTTMTLDTDLAINFWIEQSKFDGKDYYAVIKKCHTEGCECETETYYIPFTSWYTSGNYYVIQADGIAAKEMVCDIAIEIYKGTSTDGVYSGEAVSKVFTQSVVKYVIDSYDYYKANADEYHKFFVLMADALAYGAEAQMHFNHYVNDAKGNAILATNALPGISEFVSQYSTKNNPTLEYEFDREAANVYNKDTNPDGYFYGSNLSLNNTVYFNLYFANLKDVENVVYEYTFTHHNDEVHLYTTDTSNKNANGYITVSSVVQNGVECMVVSIDDLAPADLRLEVTCTVTVNGEVVSTVVYSPEDYCANGAANDPANKDLYYSVMKYADSAYAYFHRNDVNKAQ